jgi:hypothetical protein
MKTYDGPLDKRYRGMRVRARDWFWAAAAVLVLAWAVRLIMGFAGAVREDGVWVLLWSAAMLVIAVWLLLGAWRRTVWGAPAAGQRDHVELRHLDRRERPP